MATRNDFKPARRGRPPAAITIACILLWLPALWAAQDIRFEHYTSEDGLPSNELYALAESDNGYLWIGSRAGLTRFDGLNFQSLLHGRDDDMALPGRSVQYLFNDSRDRLWVGLEADGLAQVDNHLNIVRHIHTDSHPVKLPNGSIWSMSEDCHGKLWLGFPGDGVARFNPDDNTLVSVPMPIADEQTDIRVVTSVHVDRNCRVWAGLLEKGVMYLDESKNHFVHPADNQWPTDGTSIYAITSHQDHIYAAATSELGIFNSHTATYINKIDIGTLTSIERVGISSLSVNGSILWVASNAGLFSIQLTIEPKPVNDSELNQLLSEGAFSSDYFVRHYQHRETIEGSLASDSLLFVASGAHGNVWVATQDNGLVYKPPGWDNFNLLRRDLLINNHLPSNNINTAFADNEHLWIGTFYEGLARYAYRQHEFDTPDPLTDLRFRRIWAIHTDHTGNTWIAGNHEIVRYIPGRDPIDVELPDNITTALRGIRPLGFVELSGSLWLIAKHNHLVRFDETTDQWELRRIDDSKSTITFTDYLPLSEQQFLVSAESQLYLYNAAIDRFVTLLDVAENHIQQMAFDAEGYLWVAQKSGVSSYRFEAADLVRELQLRYSADLRNTVINNLDFDAQGHLWFGSLNGLYKLLPPISDVTDNSEPPFLRLTRSDGLPSSEMSENTLVRLNDGRMAIGTNQGEVLFDPREIRPRTGRPRIDINGLSTLEHDYSAERLGDAPLVFKHDDNTVSLRFNAVTFNNRDDLSYQYRLVGWDSNWITTRQVPQVTFSRLPHGKYTFNARAQVGTAEWGAVNDSVSFTIQRPPWITWWAYALYAVMAVLLLMTVRQRHLQARERRRALFQARERQQFAETQTRIATDFARAIHYEEIANTLSATLKENLPLARMLVHFPDETDPTHEFVYQQEWAERIPDDVDFAALYSGFNSYPKMRHDQQAIPVEGHADAVQLSLPLGAKRPVQAVVCLHFVPGKPPAENDIAFASLVAQTAETAVNNTVLLEQVSQLAELNQRANDAKSEFISTVSHEIRTPLHGLMGMLDLLNHSDAGHQQDVILDRLTESSQQLLSVVDDVLDISKIEANKVELHHDTFELSDVIEHVMQLFQDQAESKQLYFHGLIAPATCGWWLGDKTRLVQILTNLINNAIKFTASGGLYLTAREMNDGERGLQITVADTGLGMSEEVLERLFDEFQQAEDWTWKKYGGSGLGLSITKRLVELMDGRIEVTSAEGQGSRFDIFLPLEKPAVLAAIEPLQWPAECTIHLACGYANSLLEPLLGNGNRVIAHDFEPADAITGLSGNNQVLVTTSVTLAKQCPLPCAVLGNLGAQTPANDTHYQVFDMSADWPALQVWLMLQSLSATSAVNNA